MWRVWTLATPCFVLRPTHTWLYAALYLLVPEARRQLERRRQRPLILLRCPVDRQSPGYLLRSVFGSGRSETMVREINLAWIQWLYGQAGKADWRREISNAGEKRKRDGRRVIVISLFWILSCKGSENRVIERLKIGVKINYIAVIPKYELFGLETKVQFPFQIKEDLIFFILAPKSHSLNCKI